jgi:hypothetical protein
MAKYKLLARAYMKQTPGDIIEQIQEEGTEVELPDNALPGPHMEPIDVKAREAMNRFLQHGAPLDMAKVRGLNEGIPTIGTATMPLTAQDNGSEALNRRMLEELIANQAAQTAALMQVLKQLAA